MAEQPADADVAQLVERNLAKVEVAGSNLVIRSNIRSSPPETAFFCCPQTDTDKAQTDAERSAS